MSHVKPFVICATAGDPGGANAVAPVIERLLQNEAVKIIARPYNEAITLWRDRGIPVHSGGAMSVQEFRTLMRTEEVEFFLTGTSANSNNCEHRALQGARELGIPTLAILDYWSNYALRFSSAGNFLNFLPDRIAVMDQSAKSEMIAEGFPAGRLVVTGQPAFDDLAACHRAFGDFQRRRLRLTYGVGSDDLMVFFPSQPISAVCGGNVCNPSFPGYTEKEVISLLIGALEAISKSSQHSITLVTRPHPREDGAWMEQLRSKHIQIISARKENARELCMAADLVAGMDSVLLVEACYLRSFVLSIQPNLIGRDTLPTNRLGVSTGVYQPQAVQPAIERLLFNQTARRSLSTLLASMSCNGFNAAGVVERLILPSNLPA
jgi:hypothetical protein